MVVLSKLKEEDFAALRGPFESGRQGPGSLGAMLIFSIFLQALMFFLTYVVLADSTNYPFKEEIFATHLAVTIILIMLSIIFGVPSTFRDFQKTQYLISIIVSQNMFGYYFYIGALFTIGTSNSSDESILMVTFITLLIGLFVFIITFVRFYLLLKKGKYRSGSDKDFQREKFEKKSLIPMATVAGLGIVYAMQFAIRHSYVDFENMFFVVIGVGLLYAMLFVLPEQLVLLYCKFRFDSFNYSFEKDPDGVLKPMGTDRLAKRGGLDSVK